MTENKEKLLKVLAKLKTLAECKTGNPNETATAAAKMNALMLKHQIEMIELETEAPPEVEAINELFVVETANPSWKVTLYAGIAREGFCMPYTQTIGKKKHKRLRIIGAKEDIENCRQLFNFCVSEIERLTNNNLYLYSCKDKNDFKMGAVSGIYSKIKEQRQAILDETPQEFAMVLVNRKDDAIQKVATALELKTQKSYTRRPSASAYAQGVAAGRGVNLSNKLTSGSPSGNKALLG